MDQSALEEIVEQISLVKELHHNYCHILKSFSDDLYDCMRDAYDISISAKIDFTFMSTALLDLAAEISMEKLTSDIFYPDLNLKIQQFLPKKEKQFLLLITNFFMEIPYILFVLKDNKSSCLNLEHVDFDKYNKLFLNRKNKLVNKVLRLEESFPSLKHNLVSLSDIKSSKLYNLTSFPAEISKYTNSIVDFKLENNESDIWGGNSGSKHADLVINSLFNTLSDYEEIL